MASRGVKQTLRIGSTDVPVALINLAAKPREAQYETRRVEVDAPEAEAVEAITVPVAEKVGTATAAAPAGEQVEVDLGDPLGAEPEPEPRSGGFQPLEAEDDADAEPPPAVTIERGVTGPGGKWIDCTDQLEQIDQDTKLSAMEVDFTVATNFIPRERVTGAHYLAPAGENAPDVLVALWVALKEEQRAAVVRFTKRTNQALAAIIPRGREGQRHLVLLELAWPEEVRGLETRCNLSTLLDEVDTGSPIIEAARDFVVALSEGPSAFDDVHDERMRQRAELLEAAREGREWAPPVDAEVVVPEVEALDRALADAA